MGRAAFVLGLIALIFGVFAVLRLPLFDCPECDPVETLPCLRCSEARTLSGAGRWFRGPSDPELRDLVARGLVVQRSSADPGGRRVVWNRPELTEWRGVADVFNEVGGLRVEQSRVLAVLWAEPRRSGTPCRAVLFERTGEVIDRMDLWVNAGNGLVVGLLSDPPSISVLVADRKPFPATYFVSRGNGPAEELPLAPLDSKATTRFAGIQVRDGRLQLVPP